MFRDPGFYLAFREKVVPLLRTYPFIREAEEAGRLSLNAWWFDIAGADVYEWRDEKTGFVLVDESWVRSARSDRLKQTR